MSRDVRSHRHGDLRDHIGRDRDRIRPRSRDRYLRPEPSRFYRDDRRADRPSSDRSRHDPREYDRRHRSPMRNNRRSRSRSPRKMDKDVLDDNILSEISKLPDPSELWEGNQFNDNYPVPGPPTLPVPPAFPTPMATPSFLSEYQPAYSGLYDDFSSTLNTPNVPEWNQLSLPPPPSEPTAVVMPNVEDQMKKDAAIETEMRHQKAALAKQREDYIKKVGILKKELETLKDQRNELRGDGKRSPSPDTKRFLKENTKLQLEIQNKLKTMTNVVEMLGGIIGEKSQEIQIESDDSIGETKRRSRSPSKSKQTPKDKFNYVYYDPEMHWCRVCNEFPPTAKDYLNHLHSPAHQKMAAAHLEAPWHTVNGVNEGFPNHPSAPTKRTPIKGLQFFVPSTAWYCKLCDQFIGDLHCASAHLKSVVHANNYINFVEQNPHWETDWMSDRQKAIEKVRTKVKVEKLAPVQPEPEKYTAHKITFNKQGVPVKKTEIHPEEDRRRKKKKKKKSSSDSSSSSSDEAEKSKRKRKIKPDPDDKHIEAWMRSDQLNDKERKLLNALKNKIKMEKRDSEAESSRRRDKSEDVHKIQKKLRETVKNAYEEDKKESRTIIIKDESPEVKEDPKKTPPPVKKMPFIGKMPVFKTLAKAKQEIEEKKEEEKKEEEAKKEDQVIKKRAELDAEIQRKVQEFKQKLSNETQNAKKKIKAMLPPPGIALPTELGLPLHPIQHQPPPTATPSLQQDFQEALDILYPDANKNTQELFGGLQLPGFPMGFPGGPFPGMGMMQPSQQMMMGFDMNGMFPGGPNGPMGPGGPNLGPMGPHPNGPMGQMGQMGGPNMGAMGPGGPNGPMGPNRPMGPNGPMMNPRPSLLGPPPLMLQQIKRPLPHQQVTNKKQTNKNNKQNNQNKQQNNQNKQQNNQNNKQNNQKAEKKNQKETKTSKQDNLDELAMLGIDASDVGSGM